MADWYVDSSAVGTNSGTSPTDAAIDINSLTFGGQVAFGDRVWVRRTMNWQGNSFLCGRSGFNAFSHSAIEIIGWPLSGDQYYENRPSAGQAPWDGDAAQFTGLPGFVISTSGTGITGPGLTLRAGLFITNWTIISSIALSRFSAFGNDFPIMSHVGKMGMLNCQPRGSSDGTMHFDEVIYCGSGTTANMGWAKPATFGRFTVPTSYVGEAPLFIDQICIHEFVNLSNSITCIAVNSSLSDRYHSNFIGTCVGTTPINEPNQAIGAGTFKSSIMVGNYFGNGPALLGVYRGGVNLRIVTGSTGVYSGARATFLNVNSGITTANADMKYLADGRLLNEEHAGRWMDVKSGTNITVQGFFFSMGAMGSLDQSPTGWMQIAGRGMGRKRVDTKTVSGGIYPGCKDLWTGTSVQVGSAWEMKYKFFPTETGTLYISMRVPVPPSAIRQDSCSMFVAPFFQITTG